MDTTKIYIKMRIAAIPDLGNGIPMLSTFCSENYHFIDDKDDDVWIDQKGDWYVFMENIPPAPHGDYDNVRVCQLERQDQLQEMVWRKRGNALEALWTDFMVWVRETTWVDYFISFEQLWLAFVMLELHYKKWSGTEWVKR